MAAAVVVELSETIRRAAMAVTVVMVASVASVDAVVAGAVGHRLAYGIVKAVNSVMTRLYRTQPTPMKLGRVALVARPANALAVNRPTPGRMACELKFTKSSKALLRRCINIHLNHRKDFVFHLSWNPVLTRGMWS